MGRELLEASEFIIELRTVRAGLPFGRYRHAISTPLTAASIYRLCSSSASPGRPRLVSTSVTPQASMASFQLFWPCPTAPLKALFHQVITNAAVGRSRR